VRQPDEQATADSPRWGAILLVVCVVAPACLAMAHAANAADGAHDEAMLRAVGLGWTGAWRALDAPWCALFAWVPVGTRAMRATFASAMACGVGGGVLFVIARAMAAAMGEGLNATNAVSAKRVGLVVAAIASLAATLSPAWQVEASAPAGGCLGAVLALVPLAIVIAWDAPVEARMTMAALAAGFAFSYEPLVGLAAIGSVKVWAFLNREARASVSRGMVARVSLAFVVGCAPFVIALARRGSELATNATLFAAFAGERGESVPGMPAVFAREDVGTLSCIAIVIGMVLACLAPRARGMALALGAIVVAAVVAMICGAPAGPTRYGAPVLAAVGAAYAIAAVAMQAIVRVVGEARVPFAQASASMILVLEMALPARAADDSSARADLRSPNATTASSAWNDTAFSALPAGAALLVSSPRVETRLLSVRAAGEMRADVAIVPLFDLAGHVAMRELARDAKLQPLWHDAVLVGAPQEWSLSSLASWRPLVAPYDPSWDRALARHFVPVGLFARFEPEPRGASDRRRALDDFSATREAFVRAIDPDPELRALAAMLLRARVITLAATSERDVVAHAIDDLRPFSPRDPVAVEIVRRLSMTRGAIDVTDLRP
jgi:hypothetical protein